MDGYTLVIRGFTICTLFAHTYYERFDGELEENEMGRTLDTKWGK